MTHPHLTTRRSFIATVGFGGIALYGAWAAYGAAPLPFATGGGHTEPLPQPEAPAAHGGHGAQPETPAAPGGHGMPGAMTPEEFMRRHEEFMARFKLADGSVMPKPEGTAPQMPAGGHEVHGAHGTPPAAEIEPGPTDVYLLAYRFGFTPDELRLDSGRPYRFRMMASDVTHGASLQLGIGSRIIRLRPNVVTEQTITFNRPGPVLVYCTVFCGPAHDAMKARILVA